MAELFRNKIFSMPCHVGPLASRYSRIREKTLY